MIAVESRQLVGKMTELMDGGTNPYVFLNVARNVVFRALLKNTIVGALPDSVDVAHARVDKVTVIDDNGRSLFYLGCRVESSLSDQLDFIADELFNRFEDVNTPTVERSGSVVRVRVPLWVGEFAPRSFVIVDILA